ncbi:MAG TPA: hypothetical protein VFT00_03370 [Nocardioides sp.]|nr:hypothetical protein [Nocardioides sp.]
MSLSKLHEEIDRSFGDGPEHRPVENRIAAGHRALRRRRAAEAVAALAVVGIIGAGWYAVAPGQPVGTGPIAVNPTPTPTQEPELPWEDDIPVRYVDGELQIRDGVRVHEHIANPYDYRPPKLSDAFDLTYEGQRQWVIIDGKGGSFGMSSSAPSNGWASFADYVADQVDGMSGGDDGWPDTLLLDVSGNVVPTAGTTVHNRTDDPRLGPSFAPAGTPTGAAVVSVEGDDKSYFVVWRVIDGELDVITTPPRDVVGATFEELLSYARGKYASGEGLR